MKRITILLFTLVSFLISGNACTTFFINKNGQLIFGRNYDWITGTGMVCTNLRGLSKTSMQTEDGKTISWVSKYGSITFNQYGKEFPTGGMNEKGLVVELMWLDETKYPAKDKRPAIVELQWIQYQLDNSSTIEEVIASDSILRIASVDNAPLHFLIADANGRAATIEFLKGKMVVHKGSELTQPVLTNNIYDESLKAYNKNATKGGGVSFAYGNNSLERFGKTCSMIQQLHSNSNKSMTDYSFEILDAVAQGSFTKWSIVYDISNKTIQFKTNGFQQIKSVSFTAFDFNCTAQAKTWDMNQAVKGNINSLFGNFTVDFNRKIINKAANESSTQVPISETSREALSKYPDKLKCKE